MFPYSSIQEIFWNHERREIVSSARADVRQLALTSKDHRPRVQAMYAELAAHDGAFLLWLAQKYDISPPDQNDAAMWEEQDNAKVLSAKGRSFLRQLIDQERSRRSNVRMRWVKLLAPAIAGLAGLIGALTGLVLALKK